VTSVWSARRRSARLWLSSQGAAVLTAALVTGAVFALEYLLVSGNFHVADVAQETNRGLPLYLKMAALWSGSTGSLLFWSWISSLYVAYVALKRPDKGRILVPYALAILLGILVFYLSLLNFVSPPFAVLAGTPYDGAGLDPLLQNVWMAVHPPNLYLGFIGMAVPYAYGMAALIARQDNDVWIHLSRRWLLIAWTFLTLGLILGGYWAYTELGWGGYWAWDPVENAALMPWLAATALIHSGMVQERRGMFRFWNMLLLSGAFLLTVFGTFLTRSGFLPSVHTFSNSPVSFYFFLYFLAALAFSGFLIWSRRRLLREDGLFENVLSRESSFMLNNILLVLATVAIFWGTIFPVISADMLGRTMVVSSGFFDQTTGPLGDLLVLAMGLAPVVGWQRTHPKLLRRGLLWPVLIALVATALGWAFLVHMGLRADWRALATLATVSFTLATHFREFIRVVSPRMRSTRSKSAPGLWHRLRRNGHRYGGFITHVGVAAMLIGLAASYFYREEASYTLTRPGQVITAGGYRLRYAGNVYQVVGQDTEVLADLSMPGSSDLRPAEMLYPGYEQPLARVAIRSTPLVDLYVVLTSTQGLHGATVEVFVDPMVSWLWGGAAIAVAGALISLASRKRIRGSPAVALSGGR
jgi:cytochrome c-type biogenesis protein CcmF